MNINVSTLIERIYDRIPSIDVKTLRDIEDVLEYELKDCTITKQTYELSVVNNNQRFLKEYAVSLKLMNRSDNTIAQYVRSVNTLLLFLNKDVKDITHKDLKLFYSWYFQTHKISSTTLCNLQRFISPFFRFLTKEQYIQSNPAEFVEVTKTKKPDIEAISQEEIEIIRNIVSDGSKYSIRNRAMVEFLLATGCRVSEVVGCRISDVNFSNKSIVVTGKGNKTRTVFFNGTASKYLKDYLKTRNDSLDILFLSRNSTTWSKGGIEDLCRNIERKVGIHCNPHRFRHTYAQICVDRGMSIEDLSKLLGHESVQTTMRYFNVNTSKLETAYKKFIS